MGYKSKNWNRCGSGCHRFAKSTTKNSKDEGKKERSQATKPHQRATVSLRLQKVWKSMAAWAGQKNRLSSRKTTIAKSKQLTYRPRRRSPPLKVRANKALRSKMSWILLLNRTLQKNLQKQLRDSWLRECGTPNRFRRNRFNQTKSKKSEDMCKEEMSQATKPHKRTAVSLRLQKWRKAKVKREGPKTRLISWKTTLSTKTSRRKHSKNRPRSNPRSRKLRSQSATRRNRTPKTLWVTPNHRRKTLSGSASVQKEMTIRKTFLACWKVWSENYLVLLLG